MADIRLDGKNYVVSGANSGIGFCAAQRFAELGANVALLCRSEERGLAAKAEIIAATGNDNVRLYLADFSSLASVNAVADKLLQDYAVIDVLCNNAGGANAKRVVTEEGFETTLVCNHLSGFLLTQRLLPKLLAAGEDGLARIVFTSSYGHHNSPLNFDDLGLSEGYSTLKAYGRSKLMNLLTARELHKRLEGKNVAVSSFHPGAVRTPIWNKGGLIARVLGFLIYPFMISVEKGADTLIWLASAEEEASRKPGGKYFFKRRRTATAKFAGDAEARQLWQISEQLIAPFHGES